MVKLYKFSCIENEYAIKQLLILFNLTAKERQID
jgi:hypothetical protein